MTLIDVFDKYSEPLPGDISLDRILEILPSNLAIVTVEPKENVFDVRYSFAQPFTENGRIFAIGTQQVPEAIYLYGALIIAVKYMAENNRNEFLKKLATPGKHLDALSEIRPVVTSCDPKSIEYEVSGQGKKTIDWKFQFDKECVLLDVKNRSKNTYQHLKEVVLNRRAGIPTIPVPKTVASDFFKSTAEKFSTARDGNTVHGVWIITGIKENEAELVSYFDNDKGCESLDFFVISNWNNEAYVHTKLTSQKERICELFQITESRNHVF